MTADTLPTLLLFTQVFMSKASLLQDWLQDLSTDSSLQFQMLLDAHSTAPKLVGLQLPYLASQPTCREVHNQQELKSN
jgi:hypothetical protein